LQFGPNISRLPTAEGFDKDAEHGLPTGDDRGIPVIYMLTIDHEGDLGTLIDGDLADPDTRRIGPQWWWNHLCSSASALRGLDLIAASATLRGFDLTTASASLRGLDLTAASTALQESGLRITSV